MRLVDTSVWIDHFRSGNDALATLLYHAEVLSHPFIVGELACGNLRQRDEILPWLAALPAVSMAALPSSFSAFSSLAAALV